MAKRHRLVRKALTSLGLVYDNKKAEFPLNTVADIDVFILEKRAEKEKLENSKKTCEEIINDCNKLIEIKEKDLGELQALKDQVEIEEYKELNPGKSFFKV